MSGLNRNSLTQSVWIVAVTCVGTPAGAHGTLAGGGGFYAGAMHPFLAWEHLLLLIGLGLLLGRKRPVDRWPLVFLAVGLASGLVMGFGGVVWSGTAIAVLVGGVAAGLCLALAVPLPRAAGAGAGMAIGLAVGVDTGVPVDPGTVPAAVWYASGGLFVAVFLIVLNAMALANAAGTRYAIVLRVAGSWIAAATLMVLAFEFRRSGGGL